MHKCSVCHKKADGKCKCNKKNYCEKDYAKHSKKKGKHEMVPFEEKKEIIKKSVSFAGSDNEKNKYVAKESSAVEIAANQKVALKDFLHRELMKLKKFKKETQSCVHQQQQNIIKAVVDDAKNLTATIIEQCQEKETMLDKTVETLDAVGKIPVGNTIIEKLKKITAGESIFVLESSLEPVSINTEKILDFKIAFTTNPVIDQLRTYYQAQENSISPKLRKFYEKIFAEKHYVIKRINLSKSKIDSAGLTHLSKLTSFYLGIKELRLNSNKISTDNSEQLAECISPFKQIEKLDLSDNDLRGHGIEVLTPVFEDFKKLSSLSLARNNFGATGARHLSIMLQSLKKLKELDLDQNAFGSEGARYLSEILPKLTDLKTLKLRGNNFADDSFRFLKVAFGRMTNIEVLKLENNKFGNEEKRTMQLIVRKECKIDI